MAIYADAAEGQARIVTDPLPLIQRGVPLNLRSLEVDLDRPGFGVNPTSCTSAVVEARVYSASGAESSVGSPFAVANCGGLGLKPRIEVKLSGPARRGAHPGVSVTVRPRPSDANLSEAAVTLPPTELLDTRQVKAVCPAGRFSSGNCPKGSMIGRAEVWTPLLGQPLRGAIYLRSSANRLPVLATRLEGEVAATFVARLDSVHRRLRLRLHGIPDVPLEKVALRLFGGARGVIVDSGGVCSGKPRAQAALGAQNGRTDVVRLPLKRRCRPERLRTP